MWRNYGQCNARDRPSQPQSVTVTWPLPNYIAWWTCPKLLLGGDPTVSWTHNRKSDVLYRYAAYHVPIRNAVAPSIVLSLMKHDIVDHSLHRKQVEWGDISAVTSGRWRESSKRTRHERSVAGRWLCRWTTGQAGVGRRRWPSVR